MSGAYYNEMDPYAAQWLRNLIAAGHIAPGDVDERSIRDVSPEDLRGYTQCHFFAGIGVWSHALRNAGWSDDRPVWTGSCPCQPFSAAGKQKGFDDDRHLWPVWHRLIDECHPAIVLGEQVASALDWLDLVSTDMEASGYAFAASDLCAAGFGGAHIRQRLYFAGVGNGQQPRLEGHAGDGDGRHGWPGQARPATATGSTGRMGHHHHLGSRRGSEAGVGEGLGEAGPQSAGAESIRGLADAAGPRHLGPLEGSEGPARDEARLRLLGEGFGPSGLADADRGQCGRIADGQGRHADGQEAGRQQSDSQPEPNGDVCWLADTCGAAGQQDARSAPRYETQDGRAGRDQCQQDSDHRYSGDGPDCHAHAPLLGRTPVDWLFCRDGKWRPVEPGTFPLADAPAARVGRLRAYGNALDAETATQFVGAVMGATADLELI